MVWFNGTRVECEGKAALTSRTTAAPCGQQTKTVGGRGPRGAQSLVCACKAQADQQSPSSDAYRSERSTVSPE